ncbi:protein disulfide-isomerase A3 [Cebus imitator]|uniref:protein disulfide-isomerase A3 n=1 Tax=Cebus imitator TaxID=2715852 RepID=UPI001898A23C|nr:protein disulfide-isomerase A3 [Cebus imitator]
MRLRRLALFPGVALLLAATRLAAASDVLELTDDNFESRISDTGSAGLMLVEFFAPWVDCTANTNTCNKYGVSGYPTLKIFRDGEEAGAYDGPRTADGIVSHLKKQAGPASVPLKTEEEFQKFISDKDASVVGFFKDSLSEAHSEFLKAASNLRDNYRFAHTNVESLVNEYDDNGEVLAQISLVSHRVMMVAKKFLDAGHKLNFAVASRKTFSHELSDFGLESTTGEIPVVAIRTAKGEKFVMQEEFSRDGKALERFLQDYFDGNLKRYLKSEPIPESNDGPVKVRCSQPYQAMSNCLSFSLSLSLFFFFFCPHSLSHKISIGRTQNAWLSKDPNIVIAKMDATANDVPSPYEVRGFPTIYFSPANKKLNPKKYEGGRELSDFISYLQREATNPPVIQEEKPKKKKKAQEDL